MDEIESDFSVFHRIENPYALDSSRYFRLARLLPAYGGAVTLVMRRSEEAEKREVSRHVAANTVPDIDVKTVARMSEDGHRQNMPGIEYEE